MAHIRPPAVAGRFYPSEASELRAVVTGFLDEARAAEDADDQRAGLRPTALVAPHAGFAYSGPVAGTAYATLDAAAPAETRRVILLGPAHYVAVDGVAGGPDVPMHSTAFHPDFRMLDRPPTPPSTLTRGRDCALGNGVRYAYTGNVHDRGGGSTHCHACGQLLIGRDWFVLTDWNVDAEGRCGRCAAALPGLFEAEPGSWGSRRRPVRLGAVGA